MSVRVYVLPTQNDILDFRLGQRPENILVRDFDTDAALQAYRDGIDASGDAYDWIEGLTVIGAVASYTRHSEDPEAESMVNVAEVQFKSPAEAEAFRMGIHDAEGLTAPLLIDDTDDRFEDLAEMCCP